MNWLSSIANVVLQCLRLTTAPPPPPPQPPQTPRMEKYAWMKLKREVWKEYYGDKEEGLCYCCGIVIMRDKCGHECSHVVALARGGKNEKENLRPCCRKCNRSMHVQNMYVWMVKMDKRGPGRNNADAYIKQHNLKV